MKQKFAIEGLSCEHCVARVEKSVSELPGVQKVKVHLKKKNGVVKFDETQTSTESIIETVKETGYEASLLK